MRNWSAALVVCPLCRGPLDWGGAHREREQVLEARPRCHACGTTSVVHDGRGDFRPGDVAVGSVPRAVAALDRPARWGPTVVRARELIGARRESRGPGTGRPSLEYTFEGFGPGLLSTDAQDRGLIAGELGSLEGREDGEPPAEPLDRCVVSGHSLPFADHRFDEVLVGPGIQSSPSARIILREARRVSAGPVAVVLVLPGRASPGRVGDVWPSEFGVAHWSPEPQIVGRVGPAGDGGWRVALAWTRPAGDAPRTPT